MGRSVGLRGHMRHTHIFTLSLLLKLLNATSDVSAQDSNNGFAPVQVEKSEVYRKGELAAGECGILFSKASTPGITEQSQQRQLCFALQGFGFLTRYSRRDHQESEGWRNNVCLLLAFCGSDCHRLYGHPQNTPAAVKALTEAARLAANFTKSSEQPSKAESSVFKNHTPSPSEAAAPVESLPSPGRAQSHTKTNKAGLIATAKKLDSETFKTAKPLPSYAKQSGRDCSRPFMSISFQENCRSVYTIDFEAQHQGFGKFLARVAMLIGAVDVQEVAAIERQIQKYIFTKTMRALERSSGPVSERKNIDYSLQNHANVETPDAGAPKGKVLSAEPFHSRPLPAQKLEIILEPLFPDAFGFSNGMQRTVYDFSTPSIQISIPSGFTARIAQEAGTETSPPRIRRLRGNDLKEAKSAAKPHRKPILAGVELTSFAHCRAAAAFMSERAELQWLQQHVFFMQRR